jgi:hypothetical protein
MRGGPPNVILPEFAESFTSFLKVLNRPAALVSELSGKNRVL